MELAELYGNIGEHLRQTTSAIANDALYGYAFGFQAAYGLGVQLIGFILYYAHEQGFAADAVHQHHDAKIASEVGGVHDDVCFGWGGELSFGDGFFEMAVNGFAAAIMGCC